MQREACRYLYLHQYGGAARPALARLLQHPGPSNHAQSRAQSPPLTLRQRGAA